MRRLFLDANVLFTAAPNPAGKAALVIEEGIRPILQAALDCRATHLLAGDFAHSGPYMNRPELVEGLVVQTVGDFLRAHYPRSPL